MHPATVFFVLASLAVIGGAVLCMDWVSARMGVAMLGVVGAATLLWHINMVPALVLPDLVLACWSFALWVDRAAPWAEEVLSIFALRLWLHVAGEFGGGAQMAYFHALNATFLLALVAISGGGLYDVVNRCMHRVRDFCRNLSAPRAVFPGRG